jgi:hypothetical protein
MLHNFFAENCDHNIYPRFFETLTFDVLKKQSFAEGFLHTRFFRQLFETGLSFRTDTNRSSLIEGLVRFVRAGTDVMILKYFRQKNRRKIWRLLMQNTAEFCKKWIITLFFWEKRQFFRLKSVKIAKNCDHNIGPRTIKTAEKSYHQLPSLD